MACTHVDTMELDTPYATTHFRATEHPVVKSFEPGEAWVWCYVDTKLYEYDA